MVEFLTRYDSRADVLYVTCAPSEPARAREGEDGLVWRTSVANGNLIGVTVLDFEACWHNRIDALAAEFARGFKMPIVQAEEMFSRILH